MTTIFATKELSTSGTQKGATTKDKLKKEMLKQAGKAIDKILNENPELHKGNPTVESKVTAYPQMTSTVGEDTVNFEVTVRFRKPVPRTASKSKPVKKNTAKAPKRPGVKQKAVEGNDPHSRIVSIKSATLTESLKKLLVASLNVKLYEGHAWALGKKSTKQLNEVKKKYKVQEKKTKDLLKKEASKNDIKFKAADIEDALNSRLNTLDKTDRRGKSWTRGVKAGKKEL